MSRRALVLAILILDPLSGALFAQDALPAPRVRVIERGSNEVLAIGTLVAIMGDTVVVAVDSAATHRVVLSPSRELQQSAGMHGRALKGMGLGALLGGAVGAIIGAATYSPPPPCQSELFCLNLFDGPGYAAGAGASVGILAGGLLGAIIGSKQVERWDAMPHASIAHLVIAPAGSGGVRVGAALRF